MIRRVIVLPENVTLGQVEEFRAYWNETNGAPGWEDVFTNFKLQIIPVNPPSAHEIWLRHQVSWRVR